MVLTLLLLLVSIPLWASGPSICDIIDSPSCHGITKQVRRSSSLSLPSPAAAANINPATVSFDRGFGLETIYQSNNSLVFNVASGTGKMGGALISNSLENSFFGNRVPEEEFDLIERREDDKQYKSKKLTLALGTKVLRTRHLTLDVGVLAKRHSEIKKINAGVGVSGRVGWFTYGASYYQDDYRIGMNYWMAHEPWRYRYVVINELYDETIHVTTYSMGLRIRNLTFDAGTIQTRFRLFDDTSKINLYSVGLYVKNLLFNYGIRSENSPIPKYDDGAISYAKKQSDTYAGIQCSLNKHIILGVQYNFFLLRELSATATIFF